MNDESIPVLEDENYIIIYGVKFNKILLKTSLQGLKEHGEWTDPIIIKRQGNMLLFKTLTGAEGDTESE